MKPGGRPIEGIEIHRLEVDRYLLVHPDGVRRLQVDAIGRYALAQFQKHGTRDGVAGRCEDRFGDAFDETALHQFWEELDEAGFLVAADGSVRPPVPRAQGWNHLLDGVGLVLGWVFHPVASVALVLWFALSVVAVFHGWGSFFAGLAVVWAEIGLGEAILMVVLIVFGGMVLPRMFLQALAVRVQGGHIDEVHLRWHRWIVPLPAINYGDSFDLMARRNQWVVLTSGIRYLVFLFAVSVLGWTIWGWRSPWGTLFGILVIPSTLALLLGLLFTIRRDGYQVLAFKLREQNLWERARASWRQLCWGRARDDIGEPVPGWFPIFGLATYLTTLILWGLVVGVGGWILTFRYGPPGGQVLFLGAMGWMAQPATETLMKTVGLSDKLKFGGRGWTPRLVRIGLVLVVVVLGFLPYRYDVVGECEVVPGSQTGVRAQRQGIVQEVRVTTGDKVSRDDVLMVLGDREALAAVESAEAVLASAEAQVKLLQKGARPEELEISRQRVEIAQIRFDYVQGELSRVEGLRKQGSASEQQLERARQERDSAETMLRLSQESLMVVKQGAREETVEAAQAEANAARTALELARARLQLTHVRAPIDGVVSTPHVHSRLGQVAVEGDLLLVLQDTSSLEVEVSALEMAAANVVSNMPVSVRLFALDGRRLTGSVREVSRMVEEQASIDANPFRSDREQYLQSSLGRGVGDHAVRIRVTLDDAGLVRPGMTGYARVEIRREFLWKVLGRHIARFVRTTLWSWLP